MEPQEPAIKGPLSALILRSRRGYSRTAWGPCASLREPVFSTMPQGQTSNFVRTGIHFDMARFVLTMQHMAQKKPTADHDTLRGGFIESHGDHLEVVVAEKHLSPPADPKELPRGAGKGRKTKLAAFGLSPSIIKEGDPDYAKCLSQANKFRKLRTKEYLGLHGHVSAGVGALLASASLALAASRYLYQLAANPGAELEVLKKAAQLADSSRQNELAAWEMCAREGVMKRREAMANAGQPWLLRNDGQEKKKMGRPTNMELMERNRSVPNPPLVESEYDTPAEDDDNGRR